MADDNSTRIADTGERRDLTEALQRHRGFLLHTVRGITDEQARQRTTVSALTLGGLVKHLALTEDGWLDFVVDGPQEGPEIDWATADWSDPPPEVVAFADGHTMREDETLDELVQRFVAVGERTERLVAEVDLDHRQPLPAAPWFEAGATWSARRTVLHILAELSQHAGHADIIRESLDGQKTMG